MPSHPPSIRSSRLSRLSRDQRGHDSRTAWARPRGVTNGGPASHDSNTRPRRVSVRPAGASNTNTAPLNPSTNERRTESVSESAVHRDGKDSSRNAVGWPASESPVIDRHGLRNGILSSRTDGAALNNEPSTRPRSKYSA